MPIPRLHLFELEDFPWFPTIIRDLATDYLRFIETLLALHKPVLGPLRHVLSTANTTHIVDLCSGGGGPLTAIYASFAEAGIRLHITLTDEFPSLEAFERLAAVHPSDLKFIPTPIDATAVPCDLPGLRTMFNAFHHFAPAAARAVLASAAAAGQAIVIFELPQRTWKMFAFLFFTPIYVALATPFMRPFRWNRLLWTYLIPLVPLTCWWDGLVSVGRAYTVQELLALTSGFANYTWTAACVPVRGRRGTLT